MHCLLFYSFIIYSLGWVIHQTSPKPTAHNPSAPKNQPKLECEEQHFLELVVTKREQKGRFLLTKTKFSFNYNGSLKQLTDRAVWRLLCL